ncbi:MAG TPA: hypothetical protein VM076_07930, partial [Gemmatimonadaceae bacterium]|nr:hypothetical protein [Gemmatimonadaceae bacterium]
MIRSRAAALGTLVVALAIAVTLAIVARGTRRVPMTPEVAREMRAGAEFAARVDRVLETAPAESISVANAVAKSYLERLQLGLSSPFRLIDYALADRMLPDTSRHLLAYAILQRTLDGGAYHAPTAAVTLVGNTLADFPEQLAARHVALIDSVVAAASDPRGGELTIREAYRIAGAAGSVGRRGPWLGTQVASLARDRALARADVVNLLTTARRNKMDPLGLIPVWRLERRFAVERPVMRTVAPDVERRALVHVSSVVQRLDSLAAEERRLVVDSGPVVVISGGVSAEVARRLAWVASVRAAPPQAPIAVAVTSTVRPGRVALASSDEERSRQALGRFAERAVNEETLAAEYAVYRAGDGRLAVQPSLALLWSAVSMRAYGQERVWFPGDGGPSVPDLKDRFGLAAVSFDANVPTVWRPYYLRMLGSALSDLQRVLPAFGVRGLGVHFGVSPMRDAALAMHDPATRTVFLPVATSAGVIAHELAHDLDWQSARTRYGLRGTYSTDRAVRQYRDRLAASMLELSDAGPGELSLGTDAARVVPSTRPTEVFARNVDWFVSATLARDGRMNGYLSAVQDGVLTGYGAVAAPEVARDGAQAMIGALDEMTLVAPATRSWFVETHGRGRTVPVPELTRRVLDIALTAADRRPSTANRAAWDMVTPSGEASARALVALSAGCRDNRLDDRLFDERARVLVEAADARARGLLARRARYAAASERA